MNEFKHFIKNFYTKDINVAVLFFLSLLMWFLKANTIGVFILLAYGVTSLYFIDEAKVAVASVFAAAACMSNISSSIETPLFFVFTGIFAVYLVFTVAVYIYNNFYKKKVKISYGLFSIAIAFGVVAALLGGINYPPFPRQYLPRLVAKLGAMWFFYLLCINGLKSENRRYFAKMMVCLALLIIGQVIITLIRADNFIKLLESKGIVLGWVRINGLSLLLAMCVPFAAYLAIDSKINYLYIFFAVFASLLIFLFLSRGNMISIVLVLPVSLFFAFRKTKRKKSFLIALFISLTLIAAAVIIYISHSDLNFIDFIIDRKDSGRFTLYKDALNKFKEFPLFGTGIYRNAALETAAYSGPGIVWLWHNTPLQILACFGIVGVVCFIPVFYLRYKTPFTKFSVFKLFTLLMIIVFEIHGLVEITFVSVVPNIIVLLFLALCEVEKCEDCERVFLPKLFKRRAFK